MSHSGKQLKILRVTTVPMSLRFLLRGQMNYMRSMGFEVMMASSDGLEVEEIVAHEGVEHHVVTLTRKITPFTDIKAIFQLVKLIRQKEIDIVHSHTPKAGLIAMLAGLLAKAPMRMHTIAGIPWMEAAGLKRVLLKKVDQMAYAAATHIYPNSRGLLDFALQEKLTNPAKLKMLANGSSNGIDLTFFSTDQIAKTKEQLRSKLGLSETDFVYCFVGRVVKDKGLNELQQAMQQLPDYVKLVLVGPFEDDLDPISPDSKEFFQNSDRVRAVGYQNDVRPFLKLSDALVFPSYREGFPNVPMQAGAMGLPSIVTNINGCNEIVEDGKNGFIIEPKDVFALESAMLQLAEDKNQYLTMAFKARESIASRFGQKVVWDAIYAEYIALAEKTPNV